MIIFFFELSVDGEWIYEVWDLRFVVMRLYFVFVSFFCFNFEFIIFCFVFMLYWKDGFGCFLCIIDGLCCIWGNVLFVVICFLKLFDFIDDLNINLGGGKFFL